MLVLVVSTYTIIHFSQLLSYSHDQFHLQCYQGRGWVNFLLVEEEVTTTLRCERSIVGFSHSHSQTFSHKVKL